MCLIDLGGPLARRVEASLDSLLGACGLAHHLTWLLKFTASQAKPLPGAAQAAQAGEGEVRGTHQTAFASCWKVFRRCARACFSSLSKRMVIWGDLLHRGHVNQIAKARRLPWLSTR